jgi:hypothetical protein
MTFMHNFAPVTGAPALIPQNNGRVPNANENGSMPFFSQMSEGGVGDCYGHAARAGVHTSTPLNELFFSKMNMDAVQDGIRYRVYVESNQRFVIGRQSERELMVVMRSIYYQYARHMPTDIVGQVRELNARVIEWCVKEVLSNLLQHEQYKKDISQLPIPLPRAPIASMKGTRTLELTPRV